MLGFPELTLSNYAPMKNYWRVITIQNFIEVEDSCNNFHACTSLRNYHRINIRPKRFTTR
jgi:hypothetical protein